MPLSLVLFFLSLFLSLLSFRRFLFPSLFISLSFVLSDTLALFRLFAFRHFRISFLLRFSRPRLFARGTLCLSSLLSCSSRFIEEWRDAGQTLEPTRAKAKDRVCRKGTVDTLLSLSLCVFLSLSLSLPCRVLYEHEKNRSRRWWRREGDG